MTEATLDAFRSSRAPAAGVPPRAFNGAALRFTPGPDELRLPSSEEEPVPSSTRQAVAIAEGFGSLRLHWRGRRDVFVGSDQFLYWDPAYDPWVKRGNPPAAPDLYVAFGVANRHRNSYVMWEEGKPPDFVLEVVSPSSRGRDTREKPEIYAKIGVPEFFLYDPEDEREPALSGFGPAVSGFELRGGAWGEYRPLPTERLPGGVVGVRSKVLGLCLCVKPTGPEPLDGALRWYDPATGEFLPTRHELADAKRQAEASAEASAARAKESAARVAELEALVEKMRRG